MRLKSLLPQDQNNLDTHTWIRYDNLALTPKYKYYSCAVCNYIICANQETKPNEYSTSIFLSGWDDNKLTCDELVMKRILE